MTELDIIRKLKKHVFRQGKKYVNRLYESIY